MKTRKNNKQSKITKTPNSEGIDHKVEQAMKEVAVIKHYSRGGVVGDFNLHLRDEDLTIRPNPLRGLAIHDGIDGAGEE